MQSLAHIKLIENTGQSWHKKLAMNFTLVELIAVTDCVLKQYTIVPP